MKKLCLFLVLLTTVLILAGCSSGISEEEHQAALDKNAALESQLAEKDSELSEMTEQYNVASSDNDSLESTNESLGDEISKLEDEISRMEEEILIPQYKEEAKPVEELIAAIGKVTLEKEADIVKARENYDQLSSESKNYVPNLDTLSAAESTLDELKEVRAAEEAAAEAAKSEADKKTEFIATCREYDYTTLARDPEPYVDTNTKFRGKVVQVMEGSYSTSYRINVTSGSYGTWSDTIYVTYSPKEGEARILKDDIVTVYGTMRDLYTYTTVMGASVTIPAMRAEYIDIG